jgi:two-component system OmpR family response regulator
MPAGGAVTAGNTYALARDETARLAARMDRTAHILVVDDDARIRRGVAEFLTAQGLRVTAAADGKDADAKLAGARIDAILLDVMMPGESGLSLLQRYRTEHAAPIILLTALASETDRVVGLELGADDYVCKPFSLRELLARIRVVLRREQVERRDVRTRTVAALFRFDEWQLNARARTLTSPDGAYVALTTGEFDLLLAFAEHPNRVLNRDQLLDLSRGRASATVDRAIDVQIMRLRRKLEADPARPLLIKTVRNGGYIITPAVMRTAEA